MDSIRPINPAPLSLSAQNPAKASQASDAAEQFEALLIASMLKATHESGSSWLGTGEDAAGGSALEFAEEHLSQALASQGGLGIAHMVTEGLELQNRRYAAATGAVEGAAMTGENSASGR